MRFFTYACLILSLFANPGACLPASAEPASDKPATRTARNPDIEKRLNFHTVAEHQVFRGGQPSNADLAYLKEQYQIKTIVKLDFPDEEDRDDKNGGIPEEAKAEQLDIKIVRAYTLPRTKGTKVIWFAKAPDYKSIETAVNALLKKDQWPIYVHCVHGKDRTGLVVGLFRVLSTEPGIHMDLKPAHDEMDANHFNAPMNGLHPFLGLAEYWEKFEKSGGKALPH